jgi:hypothetical protein
MLVAYTFTAQQRRQLFSLNAVYVTQGKLLLNTSNVIFHSGGLTDSRQPLQVLVEFLAKYSSAQTYCNHTVAESYSNHQRHWLRRYTAARSSRSFDFLPVYV